MRTFPSRTPRADHVGRQMHDWARDLFPIHRSLSGAGTRQTLAYIAERLPGLRIESAASGTPAFDWIVPDEWTFRRAVLTDEAGNKIVDSDDHNLHVVGYSEPVDRWLDLDELEPHLHSLPERPGAIPFVTSYYKRTWGFCLPHEQRAKLRRGRYHAVIDSDLKPGVLNYGELILPGEEEGEILLSTYVCHPSMANNELSGPVVTLALAQWLAAMPKRRYSYRILFLPETIGSIVYLSRHLAQMKKATVAGVVVTCCGDERAYSMLDTRYGDTLADRIARHVLASRDPAYKRYDFLARGSDERQYCSPGVELPVVSIMRSKYGEYPEYHTSDDDLSLITPAGLAGAFEVIADFIEVAEANRTYRLKTLGEPQLGRRGLYPTISAHDGYFGQPINAIMDLLAYADGRHDLLAICERIGIHALDGAVIAQKMLNAGLLEKSDAPAEP